jgi:hypothetical protein
MPERWISVRDSIRSAAVMRTVDPASLGYGHTRDGVPWRGSSMRRRHCSTFRALDLATELRPPNPDDAHPRARSGAQPGSRVPWVEKLRDRAFRRLVACYAAAIMSMVDTSPEADARYHELLRRLPPERRLEAAMRLSSAVRELAFEGIRARHPAANDDELRVRLTVRLYGRDQARRLFGHVPDDAF